MTFLSKLGRILAEGFAIFAGIEPLLAAAHPGAAPTLQKIGTDLGAMADVVVQMEAVGVALSLSGNQKLTAAAAAIKPIILQSALVAGKPIADPGGFNRSVDQIISGIVGVLNSIHPDAVETTAAVIKTS